MAPATRAVAYAPYSWTQEKGWRYLWTERECVAGYPEGEPTRAEFWVGGKWQGPDGWKDYPKDPFFYVQVKGKTVAAWKVDYARVDVGVPVKDTVKEVWLKAGKHWVKP